MFLVKLSGLVKLSSNTCNPKKLKNNLFFNVFGGAVLALEAL